MNLLSVLIFIGQVTLETFLRNIPKSLRAKFAAKKMKTLFPIFYSRGILMNFAGIGIAKFEQEMLKKRWLILGKRILHQERESGIEWEREMICHLDFFITYRLNRRLFYPCRSIGWSYCFIPRVHLGQF